MLRTVLLLSVIAWPATVYAETTPPVESVAKRCVLIVKCRVEVEDGMLNYRVLETWKGKYSPDRLYQPPDGYLYAIPVDVRESGRAKTGGKEAILFFSDNAVSGDALNPGKIDAYRPDDVVLVEDGKVQWGGRRELGPEIYTLVELKKKVLSAVAKDKK